MAFAIVPKAVLLRCTERSFASAKKIEKPSFDLLTARSTAIRLQCSVGLNRYRGSGLVLLPYPVVGGMLAGTGWLLTTGGFALVPPPSIAELEETLP